MDTKTLQNQLAQANIEISLREMWINDLEDDLSRLRSSFFRWTGWHKKQIKSLEETIIVFANVRERFLQNRRSILEQLKNQQSDEKITLPIPLINQALKNIEHVFPRPKGTKAKHRIEWLDVEELKAPMVLDEGESGPTSGACVYILFPNSKGELSWFFAGADCDDDDLFSVEALLEIRQKLIDHGHVHPEWEKIIQNYSETENDCCSKN